MKGTRKNQKLKEFRLTHDELKELGKDLLREMGYNEEEIKEEYPLKYYNNNQYRIDVVAVTDSIVQVAIECGNVSYEKMNLLNELVKKVIHIPFHIQTHNVVQNVIEEKVVEIVLLCDEKIAEKVKKGIEDGYTLEEIALMQKMTYVTLKKRLDESGEEGKGI